MDHVLGLGPALARKELQNHRITELKMSTPVLSRCAQDPPHLLHCCTPYLKNKRAEAGGIMTVTVLEPRGKAVLKEDQMNSRYLLPAPFCPTLALLDKVAELCAYQLGLASKSFSTV